MNHVSGQSDRSRRPADSFSDLWATIKLIFCQGGHRFSQDGRFLWVLMPKFFYRISQDFLVFIDNSDGSQPGL